MKNKKVWVSIIVIAVLIIIIVLVILKKTNHINFNNYDTYKVDTVEDEKPITGKGAVFPDEIKTYRSNKNIGEYIRSQIKDGQEVKKGTPLIYYNTNSSNRPDLVNDINNVKEDLNHDYQNLAKHNSVTNQRQLSDDQQRLFKAQQQLNQHDDQSSKDIYATFDGKVKLSHSNSSKNGAEILKLVSSEPVIKMTVSQYVVDKLKDGDEVNFKLDSNNKNIKGKIQSIDDLPTNLEDEKRSKNNEKITENKDQPKYIVTISKLNHKVRAGYTGQVNIPLNMIEIPENSIVDKTYVFIVNKDGNVQKRKVKLVKNGNKIIAKHGLKSGDRVMEKPKRSLQDGEQVNISNS